MSGNGCGDPSHDENISNKKQEGGGIVTQHGYDRKNRLVSTQRADQLVLAQEYDGSDNLIFVTDANGNVTGYEYDALNRQIQVNGQLAAITRSTYDSVGNRTSVRDPEGRFTVMAYDARSRMVRETTNGTSLTNGTQTTHFEYDAANNQTRRTRPLGNAWSYAYDAADRLVLVTDPLLGETSYQYDANDNRISQTDALGNQAQHEYDALDRPTRVIYPDLAEQSYAYDPNGNLAAEVDPNGIVTTHTYDALDRRVLCEYGLPPAPVGKDLETMAWTYDPNSNVTSVLETYVAQSVADRVTTFQYDLFDRMLRTTDAFGRTVRYAYDANGNRTQLTDPDGQVTRYGFDALNRTASVLTSGGVTRYEYDRSSRLRRTLYPNATTAERFYDAAGRVTSIENTQNSALVSSYAYSYDLNSNVTTQLETNGHGPELNTYQYDALDRLIESVYPPISGETGRSLAYGYDAAYNRTSLEITDTTTSQVVESQAYAYNSRNQLTDRSDLLDPSGNVTYAYDASGNRVQQAQGGVTTDLVFDARDHLRELVVGGSSAGEFLYDYRGRRVEKQGDRGLERFTYDDASVLTQSDASGTTLAKYEYGGMRLVSLDHPSEGRSFYLLDALGSVVNQTTSAGGVLTRHQYDAYGEQRRSSGSSWNRFGFTGHERETESGLIYMKSRYYDPDTGTFLTHDPASGEAKNAPSLHRYLYVYANPLRYVDPTGAEGEAVFGEEADPGYSSSSSAEADFWERRRRMAERRSSSRRDLVQTSEDADDLTPRVSREDSGRVEDFESWLDAKRKVGQTEPTPGPAIPERSWGSYVPGTQSGEYAAQWYADRYVRAQEEGSFWGQLWYGGAGLASALWTEETAVDTAVTLSTAGLGPLAQAGKLGSAGTRVAQALEVAAAYETGVNLGEAGSGTDSGAHLNQLVRWALTGDYGGGRELGVKERAFKLGAGVLGLLGLKGTTPRGPRPSASANQPKPTHKNSLDYVGETHVYRVKGADGSTYKIGESAQGVRVRDGASIRAEQQARRLTRETGDVYTTEIRRTFPDKASARDYETRLIERFRRMFGQNTLSGNKTNR